VAPKAYYISTKDNDQVIKYKGAGKYLVTPEWFELQLFNPSRTENMVDTNKFKMDWKTFKILKFLTPFVQSYQRLLSLGLRRSCLPMSNTSTGTNPTFSACVSKEFTAVACHSSVIQLGLWICERERRLLHSRRFNEKDREARSDDS
jgi:hypothetical protein